MDSHWDADTAVTAGPDGSLSAVLTERWNGLGGGPLGGYTMAVGLRALAGTLPFPDPLTVAAFFLRPATHGPVDVEVEAVRVGRQVATGEARIGQGSRQVLRLLATFTDLDAAEGRTLVLNQPPDLPDPERCTDPLDGMALPGVTIADRVEYRFADMPGWARGAPSGTPSAEFWMRLRHDPAPDLLSLPLLVDAAAPAVMEIGALGSSTLELTFHLRARPVPGWLACRISTRHVIDGYHEEDVEIWDGDGRLVAQSRQLALLPR